MYLSRNAMFLAMVLMSCAWPAQAHAILLGATLIAGIYGMNFRHMPELGWKFGYPLALASMVVVMGVLYVVFKKKKWL
jgi:Mg2+ and Co2+ transporter CorA